jgi:glucuronate isomerase
MAAYVHDDFMLQSDTAKTLYHAVAASLPIIDYHNHLDAKEIYLNHQFSSIGEVWLSADHYYWRAMRSNGVDEFYITGQASDYEKFSKWCEVMPFLIGNPLYHWCHLELQKYFNLDILINAENCDEIWDKCNRILKESTHRFQSLLINSNVEVLCTTDDPLSDLEYHQLLRSSDFPVSVLPTFRADNLIQIENGDSFRATVSKLEELSKCHIESFSDYKQAVLQRIDYFHENHCKLSDIGLKTVEYTDYTQQELDHILNRTRLGHRPSAKEIAQFKTAVFQLLGEAYSERNWTMQIHIGVRTNVNQRRMAELGGGTGFSIIDDSPISENISKLLSLLDVTNKLPQTILYCLNPKDSFVLGSIIGAFQDSDSSPSKIQLGAAWWFNDHKSGIEKQLQDLANLGALGRFVGMLTDSRNILSMSRHEYFRRILCNQLGEWVDRGDIPNDAALLRQTVENVCYFNAKNYFNFCELKN